MLVSEEWQHVITFRGALDPLFSGTRTKKSKWFFRSFVKEVPSCLLQLAWINIYLLLYFKYSFKNKMKVAQYFEYSGKAPNLILFFHKIRFLKIDQLLALM